MPGGQGGAMRVLAPARSCPAIPISYMEIVPWAGSIPAVPSSGMSPGGEDTPWDKMKHLGTGGRGWFNPTGAPRMIGMATAPPTPSAWTWGSAAHLGSKPRAGTRGTTRTRILCPFTKIFLFFFPTHPCLLPFQGVSFRPCRWRDAATLLTPKQS